VPSGRPSAPQALPTSTLDLPAGAGRHPAIVGLHPADDRSRDHYLFVHLSQLLPPRGIAVARFDRRGDDVPFEEQVADALEVLHDVRSRPEIDPARVGLWGFSQGAWIAPMVAARSRDVAFLVLVASVGVTPAEQMLYGTAKHVRMAGWPENAVHSVVATRKIVDEWRRGNATIGDAQDAVDGLATHPWFDLAYVPRDLSAAGTWPDMDWDPSPIFAQVKVPVLLFYGEDDEWAPIDASVAAWRAAGVADLTVVRLPGAAHAPTLGGAKDIAKVSPDYERALVACGCSCSATYPTVMS